MKTYEAKITENGYVIYYDNKRLGHWEVIELLNRICPTEHLLDSRTKLLEAIPECPIHGECVPFALDWIKEMLDKG